eukprot:COSAG02_NODE_821_length_16794_cov_42.795747_6_plen_75_part_00
MHRLRVPYSTYGSVLLGFLALEDPMNHSYRCTQYRYSCTVYPGRMYDVGFLGIPTMMYRSTVFMIQYYVVYTWV